MSTAYKGSEVCYLMNMFSERLYSTANQNWI